MASIKDPKAVEHFRNLGQGELKRSSMSESFFPSLPESVRRYPREGALQEFGDSFEVMKLGLWGEGGV